MKKPTKILAIRERVKIGRFWLTFLVTDTGACTVRFLAGLLGILPDTLLKRINKYGAFNSIILSDEYLVNAIDDYQIIGPTVLEKGAKYTLCPGHLDHEKAVVVKVELSKFQFRGNCIRDRVECQQYSECLGDRCEIESGTRKGPWAKPGGDSDCYVPVKRKQPIISSYLGQHCRYIR